MKYIFALLLSVFCIGGFAQKPATIVKKGQWQLFVINDTSGLHIPMADSSWILDQDTVLVPYIVHDTVKVPSPYPVHDTLYKFVYNTDTIFQCPDDLMDISILSAIPYNGTEGNDGTAIETGVKFRSSGPGYIKGVKFYKTAKNTGTHTGELYYPSGIRMASQAFTNETATGWQTVFFTTPIPVAANTTYVAAVFSSKGGYTSTDGGLKNAVINGPISALKDGSDGANGVYKYTASPAYPGNSYQGSNYWVDVIFQP